MLATFQSSCLPFWTAAVRKIIGTKFRKSLGRFCFSRVLAVFLDVRGPVGAVDEVGRCSKNLMAGMCLNGQTMDVQFLAQSKKNSS